MTPLTRRRLLGGSIVAGGSALVGGIGAPGGAAAAGCAPEFGAVSVGRDDPRYQELTIRGANRRFTGTPDSVRLVNTPAQVVEAVRDARRTGARLAVRSGGHCFEDFVDSPEVRLVIDVSEMRGISYDPVHRAISVQSGATLGQLYRTLYLAWGVTLPAGVCPSVGIGGHLAGGGYGTLALRHGLAADHLYGVEVVVVDASGRVRTVVATRAPNDPNRDLWWAHTGGGGGNFGVVTRYLLRSPGATGASAAALLPRPPATLLHAAVNWNWSDINEQIFLRLVHNFCRWHEEHGGDGTTDTGIDAGIFLYHKINGQVQLGVNVDGTRPDADALLTGYLAALSDGLGITNTEERSVTPWLKATLSMPPAGDYSFKAKDAFLRTGWTGEQLSTLYRYLSEGSYEFYGSNAFIGYFGGKVNTVDAASTAMPHRDARFASVIQSVWFTPEQETKLLTWARECYRDVYASTGGVPVPGEAYSGTYINYPDVDIADPAWNRSGVPWHAFYYRDNYPRLQRVKRTYDPLDVFRHGLSVRAWE
ncbi:FAD-binding oxidoreductase [Micromonospora aurantiaca (nom. illeg.)]|uniref:FAD-binding oxidoreductase n=1 Tax=Micromonospora aurantiaca (nom. illeg.) TaxID=47850 RepID=UPI003666AFD9